MTELPRRSPPTHDEMLRTVITNGSPGLARGYFRSAAPVPPRSASRTGIPSLLDVDHGDDPNFSRPVARKVFWRGAAVPANAEPSDFWYPSNDF